jgi:hypothetical protein
MPKELTDKIKDFFNSINCKPLYILETPKAGEEVDNGKGVDFNLPKYAVIYSGDIYKKNKQHKLFKFEEKEKIDIMVFDKKGCKNMEALIKELNKEDGYKVIYNSNDQSDNSILQSLTGSCD